MEKFSGSYDHSKYTFTEDEVREVSDHLGDVWFKQYLDSGICSIGVGGNDNGPYIGVGVERAEDIDLVNDLVLERVPTGMPVVITIVGRIEAQ